MEKKMNELMALLRNLKLAQLEYEKDLNENYSTKGSLDRIEYAQSDIYEWVYENIDVTNCKQNGEE